MSLQELLLPLKPDKLIKLYNDILDAGLGKEYSKDHKAVFRKLRNNSSGRVKKIYTILSKCDRMEYDNFLEILLSVRDYLTKETTLRGHK